MAESITCNPFNLSDHINGSNGAKQWQGYWIPTLYNAATNTSVSSQTLDGAVMALCFVTLGFVSGTANASICYPGSLIPMVRNDTAAVIMALYESGKLIWNTNNTLSLYGISSSAPVSCTAFIVTSFG